MASFSCFLASNLSLGLGFGCRDCPVSSCVDTILPLTDLAALQRPSLAPLGSLAWM